MFPLPLLTHLTKVEVRLRNHELSVVIVVVVVVVCVICGLLS